MSNSCQLWVKSTSQKECGDMTTIGFYEARRHLSELLDRYG